MLIAACGRVGFDERAKPDGGATGSEARGALDATFGADGITLVNSTNLDLILNSVTARGTGYFAVGIHGLMTGAGQKFGIVGLTHDGLADFTFAGGGLADRGPTMRDYGYAAVPFDADHIMVIGDGNASDAEVDNVTIGVVDLSGAVDPSFGTGGFVRYDLGLSVSDTATSVAIGDRIVVCGVAAYDASDSHLALVGIDRTGALDLGWGTGGMVIDDFSTGGKDGCFGDVFAPSGDLIVAGSAGAKLLVTAYGPTGGRAPGFAPIELGGPGGAVYQVAIADGDLVAVGESGGQAVVVHASQTGALRAGFGVNGLLVVPQADVFNALALQPNGKLIAVGGLGVPDGTGVVARFEPDGTLDATFGTGGIVSLSQAGGLELTGVQLDPGGQIVVVGVVGGETFPRSSYFARLE